MGPDDDRQCVVESSERIDDGRIGRGEYLAHELLNIGAGRAPSRPPGAVL